MLRSGASLGDRPTAAACTSDDDTDLRQGGYRSAAPHRSSLDGWRVMSKLRTVLDEYLALRRALGHKLREPAQLLQQFVNFAEQAGASYITTDLALKWATQPAHAQRTWWAARLGMVRRFAQYCSCHDPRTRVPPPICFPIRTVECRRTFIGTGRSDVYLRPLGNCPPRWAAPSYLHHPVWLICQRRSAHQRAAASRP